MTSQPPHGTLYRYTHHRCRCEDCRRANAEYQRWYYHEGRAEIAKRELPGCGTRQSYSRGCRCGDCRTANTTYMQVWKAKQQGLPA